MSRLLPALLLAATGFALGMLYGRVIAPVQFIDTAPSTLRVDYRSDFVLMVAERYAADHDVNQALRRLALLGPQSPDRLCAEAIQFASSAPYAAVDVDLLQGLLRAIQEKTLPTPAAGTSP